MMFKYIEEKDGITITGLNDTSFKRLTIPAVIDGKKVKKLGSAAFFANHEIEELIIEEGIEEIESYCFSKVENLIKAEFPQTLKSIGHEAFLGCGSLKEIKIPYCCNFIGSKAFSWCSEATNLYFENCEELRIEESAFSFCSELKEVVLPEGLVELDKSSFSVCGSLKKVVLPSSLKTIGIQCFEGCGNLQDVILKEGLEVIGSWAFRECKGLRAIELPKSLKIIGDGAFIGCIEIRSVKIPKGVREISDWCFGKCRNIEFMEIPEGVEVIGSFSFSRCRKIKKLYLPESISVIKRGAFSVCLDAERINLGYGVRVIEERAFEMCSGLKWINIPETVEKLNLNIFYECKKLLGIEYAVKNREVEFIYIPPAAMGVKFTKKISDRAIPWKDYDLMFDKIRGLEYKIEMCIFRLKNAFDLEEEQKERYLTYLRRYSKNLILKAIFEDSVEDMGFYGDNLLISQNNIDEYIEASAKKQGRLTGYLLDYKQKRFGKTIKRFVL